MRRSYLVGAVTLLGVVGIALLLWWSSLPPSTTYTAGTTHHAVTLTMTEPGQRAIVLDLAVEDDGGRPVSVDTIDIDLVMPQMGHALPPALATQTEPGHYRTPEIEIPMTGQWNATLTLPGPEHAVIPLFVD